MKSGFETSASLAVNSDQLAPIQRAVEKTAGCEAVHIETVPVHETFGNDVVWWGVVKVFALIGRRGVARAYGWAYPGVTGPRYIAILEIPPINSAHAAVRAAIQAGALTVPST